jgi:hypothetical protein
MDHKTDLNDMEKRKFLTLLGPESQPLSYPASHYANHPAPASKVKLVLCLTEHYSIKTYGRVIYRSFS